jgi:SAM-dependent methyltransferase
VFSARTWNDPHRGAGHLTAHRRGLIPDSDRILLDVGCGEAGNERVPAMFASWRHVRVDIDPGVKPNILAGLADLSPVASGSADALWTAHCLEHLYQHEVPTAMSEIRRVLKDDGFACIVVPDLQRIAALIAEDKLEDVLYRAPAGPITPHDIVFGHGPALARGFMTMAHRCGFTPTALTRQIHEAAFGGYALLRTPRYELAAVVRRRDWASTAERDGLLAALAL